jgi:hypothetical protein
MTTPSHACLTNAGRTHEVNRSGTRREAETASVFESLVADRASLDFPFVEPGAGSKSQTTKAIMQPSARITNNSREVRMTVTPCICRRESHMSVLTPALGLISKENFCPAFTQLRAKLVPRNSKGIAIWSALCLDPIFEVLEATEE